KVASIFVVMPTPVMGASLVFAASFMVLAGISIMTSRMMDARKTFVIGTSIVFGLSVDIVPGLYDPLPGLLKPFFQSSLSAATLTAILLNLLFRIGIAKKAAVDLIPGVDSSETIFMFMQKQGGLWGALPDVVNRAAAAVNETLEALAAKGASRGPIRLAVSFDEFNLDAEMTYAGTPLSFASRKPSEEDVLNTGEGLETLAVFLILHEADNVDAQEKNGHCRIRLHFNH
ncbi:MAG TPA: solute carrier family 23 protein, partial [Smithellaceae bacterium]|nr:solute carrier family 23 protein [Smithellaceae bacterium]